MCFCKALDIDFATMSSAGSLRPHSDTVKKIPGLRPGHVLSKYEKSRPVFVCGSQIFAGFIHIQFWRYLANQTEK